MDVLYIVQHNVIDQNNIHMDMYALEVNVIMDESTSFMNSSRRHTSGRLENSFSFPSTVLELSSIKFR